MLQCTIQIHALQCCIHYILKIYVLYVDQGTRGRRSIDFQRDIQHGLENNYAINNQKNDNEALLIQQNNEIAHIPDSVTTNSIIRSNIDDLITTR